MQFPDPATVAIRRDGLAMISLPKLIELKLASGDSTLQRLRDIGDVLELIKRAKPVRDLSDALDPYVRAKYLELWDIAQLPDPLAE